MHMVAATQLMAYVIANTLKLAPLPRSGTLDFDEIQPDSQVIDIEDDSQVADIGLANIQFEGTGVTSLDSCGPSSSKRRRLGRPS
eukprot:3246723-Pyramimonas_sp.AAC.1